jgi:hypothetical protein
MTLPRSLVAAALVLAGTPAAAQLSNRSIAVESGLSAPLRAGGGAAETFALSATAWLDGDLEAVARLARWAGPRTPGRVPDGGGWTGTAGLRLSLLPEPLRPQLWIEAGWARVESPDGGAADRLALGAGAGLEWFVVRDVSVAMRGAVRGAGAAQVLELVAGLAAYF